MSADNLIEIRDLVVRYDATHTVLNGVSLNVKRGERIAILGPSGVGKTTLLRAINGFVRPLSGEIRVDGQSVTKARGRALREIRRHIAVVSQRHDLVDPLSVRQNVMAGALGRWGWWRALRFLVWPSAEESAQAAAALRKVGLEHKLLARTSGISGGEHQRVAIARALVQEPVLLLADEPVASLDSALSEQIVSLLCSLAGESHVTLICSLHQQSLAERFFERVIEMRGGNIAGERLGAGLVQP